MSKRTTYLLLGYLSLGALSVYAANVPTNAPLPADVDTRVGAALEIGRTMQQAAYNLVEIGVPSLVGFAWFELGCIAIYNLQRVMFTTLASFAQHHHGHIRFKMFVAVMVRTAIAVALLASYSVAYHGGLNWHQIPQRVGINAAEAINRQGLIDLFQSVKNLQIGMQVPSAWQLFEVVGYFLILILMGLSQAGMLMISLTSLPLVGTLIVIGVVFVPWYASFKHEGLFWKWFHMYISFCMYPFVASCVGLCFGEVFLRFFNTAVGQDYTIGHLKDLIVIQIVIIPSLFMAMKFVPSITDALFGGMAGVGQGISDGVINLASRGVQAAAGKMF